MSNRPCALHSKHGRPLLFRNLVLLIACACLLFPLPSRADESAIVYVVLNQQKKGDFFVILRENGDFLVRIIDLEEMGFRQTPGERVEVNGESFVSLTSMTGVAYRFDEATLTLELDSLPQLLPKTILDLAPSRRVSVLYPRDNSFFLNYGVDYSAGGESLAFEGFTVSNEVGIRLRDILLLTDTLYTETPDESSFVRLSSSLTWDNRESMRRLVAGDFCAFSGDLGSRVNMGGLSYSKIFRIDPYFIRYPLFDFSGQLSLPSEVELYLDGTLRHTERFAPGEFELRNFQSIGGAQTVEIIIRDAFGREQRIVSPFFFTDQILRKGLHEYSYNVGLLRKDFGRESNRYEKLAFSGFHRYGISDNLNLGVRGEAGDGLVNLGAESAFKTGSFGLLRLEAAASRDSGETGAAGLLNYEIQSRTIRVRLGLQGFSEEYLTLGDIDSDPSRKRKLDLRAGIGYVAPRLGSFGVDYFRTESYDQRKRETLIFSWARRLLKWTYLNLSLRQVRETDTTYEATANLTWNFGPDHSMSASYRREEETDIYSIEARRNTPVGEGTGWIVGGERSERESSEAYRLNSFVQHNARQAILRGEYSLGRSEDITTEDLRVSVSGALVYVGDTFALTRPVTDSFGLVKVGEAEGVRVYVGNQAVGRTDAKGKAIIPSLTSYYDNQVSIEDKDIPLEYLMPRIRLDVSPPLRSGSCLNFPLHKYQAFTGTLMLEGPPDREPLAFAELTLAAPAGPLTFWTSGNGEFYFDSQQVEFDMASQQGCEILNKIPSTFLPPGTYPVKVRREDESFQAEIIIPATQETFADLGEIVWPAPPSLAVPAETPAAAPTPIAPSEEPTPEPTKELEEQRTAPPAPSLPETVSLAEPAIELPHKFVVYFPFDRSVLVAENHPTLESAVHYVLEHPELHAEIEGHTDRLGSERYNLLLGLKRAQAIKEHLVAAGVSESRIRVVSYGEKYPVCEGSDEECLKRNRRAVVIVVKEDDN